MMLESDIRALTGLDVVHFWKLVGKLAGTELPKRVKALSLPSVVLLYRYYIFF